MMSGCGLDSAGYRDGTTTRFCEHSNEPRI